MKRILVVEDEDVIRDFEVINLKRSGYEVVDVPSGEEALQIFDRNPAYFDVAVLDVMMPGIDGFEVCRRIREKNSSIGIIMLTAKSQEMDKVNGLMIGADDYVTKPFSPSELVARVDALYRRVAMAAEKAAAPAPNEIKSGPLSSIPRAVPSRRTARSLSLLRWNTRSLNISSTIPTPPLAGRTFSIRCGARDISATSRSSTSISAACA